ncbi:MAG: Mini-ribonuclease 3 [Eubacteriaceae bacterium]
MEKSLEFSELQSVLNKKLTKSEAMALNPLTLAYIGDSIFSNTVRHYLIGLGHQNVNFLTKKSISYVKADAQALIIHQLMEELSEEETRIVKRGRNTTSHVPKNAKVSDYRYATGFEALLGFLSLCGEDQRLEELMIKGINIINQKVHS